MDIVKRLRVQWSAMGDMANAERLEAADEIERLRWENSNMEKLWGKSEGTWMGIRDKQELEIERLREALKEIEERTIDKIVVKLARAALKGD